MVNLDSDVTKRIVNSNNYNDVLLAVKRELGLSVLSSYDDIFASLDAAAISRSELEVSDIEAVFVEGAEELKAFSIKKYRALNSLPEEQDYPVGEEPEDSDKDENIISKGYARGFLLGNAIEFLLAKRGKEFLERYLKLSRIPKASTYTKQILSFLS